jgi:hypothetical protein
MPGIEFILLNVLFVGYLYRLVDLRCSANDVILTKILA